MYDIAEHNNPVAITDFFVNWSGSSSTERHWLLIYLHGGVGSNSFKEDITVY